MARVSILNSRGEPLASEELGRFRLCDFLTRPFPAQPKISPGEVLFVPPERPFRIALTLPVPGFGHTFVCADNRGRGYTEASFAGPAPLPLHEEFASDRLQTVRKLAGECSAAGVVVPAKSRQRIDKAAALLGKGLFYDSLAESMWAGEELVVERARQAIEKRGARPGFLFGCDTFGYPRLGKGYAAKFEALFNYATLPVYLRPTEPVQSKPDWSFIDKILGWLETTPILKKGHPLVWFSSIATPEWMRNKPYAEVKRLALKHVTECVLRYRHTIHIWDVINEAHMQNELGFTDEQQIEMTAAAARSAREADPTCVRVINNTLLSSPYMTRGKKPGQRAVYDYVKALDGAGIDYEVLGLQYYYEGFDLLETERTVETFRAFGKPVHITEMGLPSTSAPMPDPLKRNRKAFVPWHGEQWTEATQADWAEQFYTLAFSKPWIEALTWWDLAEPAYTPAGGLINADLSPKESYTRLLALLSGWRRMT